MENEDSKKIPAEVEDFLYSKEYKKLIDSISKSFALNQDQRNELFYSLKDFLMEEIKYSEFKKKIGSFGISNEISLSLIKSVEDSIIDLIYKRIVDDLKENDREEIINELDFLLNKKSDIPQAPTPKEMVDRLNQTLKQSTTIAPVKRDYSLEKPDAVITPKQPNESLKKTLDPYREFPQ